MTNKGDLISREALKKAIEQAFETADLSEYEACICVSEIYDKEIDNAPTVPYFTNEQCENAYDEGYEFGIKTQRPQGEWARHDEWRNGEYIGGFYHINCPEIEKGTALFSKWESNYCPNCGANMRGKEE